MCVGSGSFGSADSLVFIFFRHFSGGARMADTACLSEQLFLSSLSSLQPASLLDPRLRVDRGRLSLVTEGKEQHFSIPPSGLVLAGFGKAVLGLAAHLATRLGNQVSQDGCIPKPQHNCCPDTMWAAEYTRGPGCFRSQGEEGGGSV